MAQQLYFSRDSQMFLEIGSAVWKIPVLEGFSFSQATNTSEITLAEMESTAGTSRRGRRAFNDSLAPVDFSFSTYIRPFKSAGGGTAAQQADSAAEVHAVEEALWALFGGPADYAAYKFGDETATPSEGQVTPGTVVSDVSFAQSNVSTLGPTAGANLYFEIGDANKICYKLAKIAINEASIDFDIDGVAQINWSGFADTITDISKTVTVSGIHSATATLTVDSGGFAATDDERRIHGAGMTADVKLDSITTVSTVAVMSSAQTIADNTVLTLLGPAATVTEGIDQTNNFIRNRLTKVFITPQNDPANALEASYTLTLTGGNITLSNNITYLTPEELGTVNIPIGHVTGARAFGGSMTCYLTETTDDTTSSRDFFEDLTSTAQRSEVNNDFRITFLIGGGTAITNAGLADPGLHVDFAHCHVDIPTHSIEDVITLESTFMALPSTIELADEVVMKYKGPAAA